MAAVSGAHFFGGALQYEDACAALPGTKSGRHCRVTAAYYQYIDR